jgi:flavin-dependent dehydrogenase
MNSLSESRLTRTWFGPSNRHVERPDLKLTDGSRVAVMGGGPAGSLFAHYTLDLAETIGLELDLDLYDPQDFVRPHPTACNMCGGIISETLVQNLATDGINLPETVVQRGIEAYVLHMDRQEVRIETPVQEKRIASVYRGTGPRKLELEHKSWKSFDGHLQQLALNRGARPIRERVTEVSWQDGYPRLAFKGGKPETYDLVAVAVGVNSPSFKLFESSPLEFKPPTTTKTFIREYHLGETEVEKYLGDSMHVFLLNIPGIEFAAIIPKLNCATVCLLGDDIGKETFQLFLDCPEVTKCMPADWELAEFACHCSPRMNIGGVTEPFGDRVVFVGDSGVSRLYKDGIGAAYRTAKAAAGAAVFQGVSAADFRRHYGPICRSILNDNRIGRLMFAVTTHIQNTRVARQAVLRNVIQEQGDQQRKPLMSSVLWDMFTGSASYREIFLRTLRPGFVLRFAAAILASVFRRPIETGNTEQDVVAATAGGGVGQR